MLKHGLENIIRQFIFKWYKILIILLVTSCIDSIAPPMNYTGGRCIYTDTVVTQYSNVIIIAIYDDPNLCAEIAHSSPNNTFDRRP